jgi:Helix-turn-helix domain
VSKLKTIDMRFRVLNRLIEGNASPAAFMLAYIIGFKYGSAKGGEIFPSQETLAKDMHMSARHIRRLIEELEPYGLEVDVRPGRRGTKSQSYYNFHGTTADISSLLMRTSRSSNADTQVQKCGPTGPTILKTTLKTTQAPDKPESVVEQREAGRKEESGLPGGASPKAESTQESEHQGATHPPAEPSFLLEPIQDEFRAAISAGYSPGYVKIAGPRENRAVVKSLILFGLELPNRPKRAKPAELPAPPDPVAPASPHSKFRARTVNDWRLLCSASVDVGSDRDRMEAVIAAAKASRLN